MSRKKHPNYSLMCEGVRNNKRLLPVDELSGIPRCQYMRVPISRRSSDEDTCVGRRTDLRTEANARSMLAEFLQRIDLRFGPELIDGVILVGSLTTGSYIAGPGADIDQITIVRDGSSHETVEAVIALLHEVEEEMSFGIPFAREVFFRHELERPFRTDFEWTKENKKYTEVPVELLRMHESGQVVWGDADIISKLPVPTREEVVAFNKLSREWSREAQESNTQQARSLRALPARISAQVILTNAFRHYYYATGESCSNKLQIADRMRRDVRGYRFQNALELSTILKKSVGHNKRVLADNQIDIIFSDAEAMVEWQQKHAVDEIPLNEGTEI